MDTSKIFLIFKSYFITLKKKNKKKNLTLWQKRIVISTVEYTLLHGIYGN